MNPKVDEYIEQLDQWTEEVRELRTICLGRELVEEFKWRQPCYTVDGGNVVAIGAFKSDCRLMFFKGSALKDRENVLEQLGPNTRGMRVVRFESLDKIRRLENQLKSVIDEAIEAEKNGVKIPMEKDDSPPVPEEFEEAMQENPQLREAFESLTPGRKRGYLLHFGSAKQSATRKRRVDKEIDRILKGKGLHD